MGVMLAAAVRTHAVRRFAPALRATLPMARYSSGIKIIEDTGRAQEKLYWAQEDEKLLKKMIENHPELNHEFSGMAGIDDGSSAADKVKMVFIKHGIPPINKALIADMVELIEK